MFYSTAFSDWNSVALQVSARPHRSLYANEAFELNLAQVGNFEIARMIGFVIANHPCGPPMARSNSWNERLFRAARRTRDKQIHPLIHWQSS